MCECVCVRVCMCMCVCMILYNSACTSHPLKHAYLQCVLFHHTYKNSGWIPRIEEPYICCTTGLHDRIADGTAPHSTRSQAAAVIIPSHPEMAHTKAVILLFISNPINRSDYMYRKVDAKLISTAHKLSLRNTLRNYSVKEYWY